MTKFESRHRRPPLPPDLHRVRDGEPEATQPEATSHLKKLDVASLSDALLQPRCPQALQVAPCRHIRESIECLCTFCALLTVEGLDGGEKKNSEVFCNFPLCLSLSAGKKVSAELRVLKPRRQDISSWLCFFKILFHFFFFFPTQTPAFVVHLFC